MQPLRDGDLLLHEVSDALKHRLEVVLLRLAPLQDVERAVHRLDARFRGARTRFRTRFERVDVRLVLRRVEGEEDGAARADAAAAGVVGADAAAEVVEELALLVADLDDLRAAEVPARTPTAVISATRTNRGANCEQTA